MRLMEKRDRGFQFAGSAVWRFVALAVLVLLAAACGGGGGNNRDLSPIAAGLVVGPGQDQVTVTVRAGTEFVLNAENSDGIEFPIRSAVWTQTDSTGLTLELVKRTELSRAVQIPNVSAPVTLTFQLALTNTDGNTSRTDVTVNVIPVLDGDRFLEFYRQVPGQYSVIAALQAGTTATSDVEFRIVQQELADYPNRNTAAAVDTANEFDLAVGVPITKTSVWPAGTTATWQTLDEAVTAFYHPNLCFALPQLDIDDINIQFDDTEPDRGIFDHHRDEVIHKANLRLEVTSGTCADANGDPIDCQDAAVLMILRTNGTVAVDTVNTTPADKTIEVAALGVNTDPTVQQRESAATAQAYYEAVDPFDRRLTFGNWLQNAGFTDGSGARIPEDQFEHTLYLNNYDLGFTRDMFVRTDPSGDVFAYVVNYPALRKALQDQDAFAAVAMEYAPPDQDPTGERFVKFFAYIPDNEGNFQRVKMLNFDGRGEKAVPGTCIPCHGGEPRNLDADGNYPDNGNINAAFLPWDIDSLLFVKADDPALLDPLVVAGFEVNRGYISDEDLQAFSLETQQPIFRRMNEAVLSTMVETPAQTDRFSLVREQIHGWYGNFDPATFASNSLPANAYNGRGYIQDGWAQAGLEDVYHEVYSRHCRICHSQAFEINQFATLDDLTAVLPDVQRFVYEDGVMPGARLDMDRFWVDFRGAQTSAANRFAAALGIDPAVADGLGRPIARIAGAKIQSVLPRAIMTDTVDSIDAIADVENEDGVRLDGSISSFAESYAWSFTERPVGSAAQLVGDTTAKPAFQVDAPGRYVVQLTVNNGRGPASTETVTIDATPTGPKLAAAATLSITLPEATPSQPSDITIGRGQLEWVDADSAPADLMFTVTTPPTRGTLSLTSFTQAQINNGELVYSQTADNDGPTDGFAYTITDDTGNTLPGQTFAINITALNDEPVQRLNGPLDVTEGATVSLFGALEWTDVDDVPAFTLTALPGNGDLRLSAATLGLGDSFTQSDIDNNNVTYAHDGSSESASDALSYSVSDSSVVIGPITLNINVANVNDVPQLLTRAVSVDAAREVRLSAALSTSVIPAADLAVLDSDTTDPAAIIFTVEAVPADGNLLVRSGGSDVVLSAGNTFTLAQVDTGDMNTGVFYASGLAADAPTDADSFELSVSDGEAGTCIDTVPASASCTVAVTVNARTDGPTGTSNPVSLDSLLDPARARDGSDRTSSDIDDVPWGDVVIDDSILNFVDSEITGEGIECPLRYRVVSPLPAGNLKRGDAPLTSGTDPDILGVGDEFTHAEVVAGDIYYENREVNQGIHTFNLEVTDCLFTLPTTLTITRTLDFETDVGFVMDTRWDDASPFTVVLGCPATQTRGCRDCHAGVPTTVGGFDCGIGVGGVRAFTLNELPGSTPLNCTNLANARDGAAELLSEPTPGNFHLGGDIYTTTSFPYLILQEWDGTCP